MRLLTIAGSVTTLLSSAALILACSQEETPNPPATRDGTEATEPTGNADLPGSSDPSVGTNDPNEGKGTTSGSSSSGSSSGGSSSGSSSGALPNGPTSGVDQSKAIGSLSSSEKKQFCDWQAGINGGYGKSTSCPDGLTVSAPKTQSACIAKLPPATCTAPVGELEACLKVDAQDPCALAILKAPECASIRACLQ